MLPGVTSDLQARRISIIHKRLATAQNNGHLCRRGCSKEGLDLTQCELKLVILLVLPKILEDTTRAMRSWGNSDTQDPFECIPKVRPRSKHSHDF